MLFFSSHFSSFPIHKLITENKESRKELIFLILAPSPNFNVYVDSLAAGWEDWSWSTDYTLVYSQIAHSGSDSIRFVPGNWEVCKREQRERRRGEEKPMLLVGRTGAGLLTIPWSTTK
jgi:hypothetical protein